MAAGVNRERRGEPRVVERLPLAVVDGGTVLATETRNLSASGVYCTLDRFIAPMTKLRMEWELPLLVRRVRIRCTGVVVRVEPVVANPDQGGYRVAILFTELSPRHRAAITRFIRQRLSSPSAPV
jgi:hypothetical protein